MRADRNRRLLVVFNCGADVVTKKHEEIGRCLMLADSETAQVEVHNGTSKEFLDMEGLADFLVEKVPTNPDLPF